MVDKRFTDEIREVVMDRLKINAEPVTDEEGLKLRIALLWNKDIIDMAETLVSVPTATSPVS